MNFAAELPPDIDIDESPPDINDSSPDLEIEASQPSNTNDAEEKKEDQEEKTMMQEMMEVQAIEQKKKIAKREAKRKKQDKTFGSGLKGGFFNQPTKTKTKKKKNKSKNKKKSIQSGFLNGGNDTKKITAKKEEDDDDVDFEIEDDIIRPKMKKSQQKNDIMSSLRIDEVQAAMKTTVDNQSSWMTPEFMQRIATNPKLAMGMANPRCMQAMQDFQTDPSGASEKYKDDQIVGDFMQEFMGMMGDQMHRLGEKEKRSKEINEKAQKEEAMKKMKKEDPEVAAVLSNPEVFELLNDPEMKAILKECSEQQYALGKYMQDPKIRKKLMMMKKYGLIQF